MAPLIGGSLFRADAGKKRTAAYNRLAGALSETKWQIYFAAVFAAFICFAQLFAGEGRHLAFPTASSFQSYIFGVGGICAIIAPLVFALVIQQGQKAHGDKLEMFARYQDLVIELREYLNKLYESRGVSNQYVEFLSSLEMTKESEFDGPDGGYSWWNVAAMGLVRWLEDEAAEEMSSVDFDEVHHELLPRLSMIEGCIDRLHVNAIKRRVVAVVLIEPVLNLFWNIAVVLGLAIVSSISYQGVLPTVYFFAAMFVSAFLVLILFQLGRYAKYEALSFSDD